MLLSMMPAGLTTWEPFHCISQDTSRRFLMQNIQRRCFDLSIVNRAKTVDGDYPLRERAFHIVPAEASKILGIFDWSGTSPLLLEIWLLPFFLPIYQDMFFIYLFWRLYPVDQLETAIYIYVCRFLWDSLHIFVEPFLARWPFNKLVRERALRVAMEHVNDEDANSHYISRNVLKKFCA